MHGGNVSFVSGINLGRLVEYSVHKLETTGYHHEAQHVADHNQKNNQLERLAEYFTKVDVEAVLEYFLRPAVDHSLYRLCRPENLTKSDDFNDQEVAFEIEFQVDTRQ